MYIVVSAVANAKEAYGKIDVSAPAIVGGQVTFRITMMMNCSHTDNWHYTIGNISKQLFHVDNSTTIIRKDKNTYTLTLKNATSTYHKSNISFVCGQIPIDTVTLDLRGKLKLYNVCMHVYSTKKKGIN